MDTVGIKIIAVHCLQIQCRQKLFFLPSIYHQCAFIGKYHIFFRTSCQFRCIHFIFQLQSFVCRFLLLYRKSAKFPDRIKQCAIRCGIDTYAGQQADCNHTGSGQCRCKCFPAMRLPPGSYGLLPLLSSS